MPFVSHRARSGEGWMLPRRFKLRAYVGMQQCFSTGKQHPHGLTTSPARTEIVLDLVDVDRLAAFLQSCDGQGKAVSKQDADS